MRRSGVCGTRPLDDDPGCQSSLTKLQLAQVSLLLGGCPVLCRTSGRPDARLDWDRAEQRTRDIPRRERKRAAYGRKNQRRLRELASSTRIFPRLLCSRTHLARGREGVGGGLYSKNLTRRSAYRFCEEAHTSLVPSVTAHVEKLLGPLNRDST